MIALMALFFSLAGGVYAASKINGNQIKEDSVTGKQVEESSLGTVPSAGKAATLSRAGASGFVASSRVKRARYNFTADSSSSSNDQQVLKIGPLTLTATCAFGPKFEIDASSSAQISGFDAGWVNRKSSGNTQFDKIDTSGAGLPPNQVVVSITDHDSTEHLVGNIIYNDASTTISIPFAMDYSDGFGTTHCSFNGTGTLAK